MKEELKELLQKYKNIETFFKILSKKHDNKEYRSMIIKDIEKIINNKEN